MRKTISIVLVLVLLAALVLTGCQSSKPAASAAPSSAAPSAAPSSAPASTDASPAASSAADPLKKLPEGITLGMTLIVNDGLFATMAKYIQYFADNYGFTLKLDVGAFSPEDQVKSVENLIAAGCDAIIFCNFSAAVLPKVASTCEESEVYWAIYCRSIDDPAIVSTLASTKYFVGNAYEDNAAVAKNAVEKFKELGITKTAIIGPPTGDTTTDTVSKVYQEEAAKAGITIYTEVRNIVQPNDATTDAETVVSNFPDVEGIMLLAATQGYGEGLLKGLENVGKLGKITVCMNDCTADIANDMAKGNVAFACSGQYQNPGLEMAMLLNAVMETPLSPDKITIHTNYIMFSKADSAANYFKYIQNPAENMWAYNLQEISQLIKYYNPNVTVDDYQKLATAYSYDDVLTRHNITP